MDAQTKDMTVFLTISDIPYNFSDLKVHVSLVVTLACSMLLYHA